MDEDEEDWRTLLELYLPPVQSDGQADKDEQPDDAPWRTALRAAAQHAQPNPNGAPAHKQPVTRKPPPPAIDQGHPPPPIPTGPAPRRGDRVAIASLAWLRGTVLAVTGGHALVETESARIRISCHDLVVVGADGHRDRPSRPALIRRPGTDAEDRGMTVRGGRRGRQRWHGIDLHGLRAAEALARLDDFLFTAWDDGRDTVAVVHGKGAGTLRTAVRAMLSTHPVVRHTLTAAPHSGGDGVTLVQLRRKSDLFDDRTP